MALKMSPCTAPWPNLRVLGQARFDRIQFHIAHSGQQMGFSHAGDWREELVVLNGNTLHIYHNDAPNPNPDHPRLWKQAHYGRTKRTHNYYSP